MEELVGSCGFGPGRGYIWWVMQGVLAERRGSSTLGADLEIPFTRYGQRITDSQKRSRTRLCRTTVV